MNKRISPVLGAEAENLSLTDPNCHYHMANDTKNKINIRTWPGDELDDDPACKNFLPQLLDHLLSRLLGTEYDGGEVAFSSTERSTVTICNNLVYSHKVLHVNYTTYDLRREQDTINIRTKPDIMLLSREDSPNEDGLQYHPYWYARVIGIFHTYVIHAGPASKNMLPQRMDFIQVRWFGRDNDRSGWKSRRLLKIGFFDLQSPGAFGFIDPALIIRGAFLEPAFAFGCADDLFPLSIARQPSERDTDWQFYYVNIFVDRDMVLRYFGGGVGHASTRNATNHFLTDRCQEELEDVDHTTENVQEDERLHTARSNEGPDREETYDFDSDRLSYISEEGVDEDEDEEMDGEECEDNSGEPDDL
ncbi:hypothetical protein APHAL10511_008124 [Amanita phalloides]|nr:hypothetical protein APHAL10511_008124 [Amanita phalloides]